MFELQSNELECTTNLRKIYDRLPDHLQAKWRKTAKLYREKADGREPTLKELSKFITAESQTETDPVYGRASSTSVKFNSVNSPKKPVFTSRPTSGARITTLATEVLRNEADRGSGKTSPGRGDRGSRSVGSRSDVYKVCKGTHIVPKCPVFLSTSVA